MGLHTRTQESQQSTEAPARPTIGVMDEGCKSAQQLQNIMANLDLLESQLPIPLFNDTNGAVEWSKGVSISKNM
jgi:hypothetical protein